jgi:hypothetical protein
MPDSTLPLARRGTATGIGAAQQVVWVVRQVV